MNTNLMIAIGLIVVVMLAITGSVIAKQATTNSANDANTNSVAGNCASCGENCNAENNCGSVSCQAKTGNSCSCLK